MNERESHDLTWAVLGLSDVQPALLLQHIAAGGGEDPPPPALALVDLDRVAAALRARICAATMLPPALGVV